MNQTPTTYLISCPACGATNRVPASREGEPGKCGSCRAQLPPLHTKPIQLTDRSFDGFVKGYAGPVLVEFWAPW